MTPRRNGHANRCANCRVNNYFCVCANLSTFKVETNVSLIVHVSELNLTSNTAQFVKKNLPASAEIFVRGRMNDTFNPDPILERSGRPLFLFPDEHSVELNAQFMAKNPGPYHLIVPDGNWTQAKRVKKREEKFDDVPTVRLPAGIIGEYKLRKAPQPEWVSTYEAVAYALGILESKACEEHLMKFFRVWVQATLNSRSGNFSLSELMPIK